MLGVAYDFVLLIQLFWNRRRCERGRRDLEKQLQTIGAAGISACRKLHHKLKSASYMKTTGNPSDE